MFFLKRQTKTERQITQLNNTLSRSFANVKKDTQNIFAWLNYLQQQNGVLQQTISNQWSTIQKQNESIQSMQQDLKFVPKKPEDIKRIIDTYYSFDAVLFKIKELNQRVDHMQSQSEAQYQRQQFQQTSQSQFEEPRQSEKSEALSEIKERLTQLEEQRKATVREKVIKRVTKNSKEYVKSLIMSYIRKYTQISALQLKEMIVEDQGLVSKSSFYRLLDEIEKLHEISAVKKGKQKYFMYKITREH